MMKNPGNIIILGLVLVAAIYFLSTVLKSSSSSSSSLPSPTPSKTALPNLKVKLSKDCNYEENILVREGEYNGQRLRELEGYFYREISSMEIPQGLKVVLYEGDNFDGPSAEFVSSVRCLSGHSSNFNDRAGSMKILPL